MTPHPVANNACLVPLIALSPADWGTWLQLCHFCTWRFPLALNICQSYPLNGKDCLRIIGFPPWLVWMQHVKRRQGFLTENSKTHWKIVYLKCLQMSQFQSTEETASCKEKLHLPTCTVKILSNCFTSLEIYLWSLCACWRSLCLWDGLNFALQFSHTWFFYCCWVSSPARRKYRNSGVCFLYSGMASFPQYVANKDNHCSIWATVWLHNYHVKLISRLYIAFSARWQIMTAKIHAKILNKYSN